MSKWLLTRRPRAAHVIIACGLVIVAAIAARIAVIVADLHNRALADRERELQNIGLVLAHETDRTFQVLDLLAGSLTERMETLGIRSSEAFRQQMSSHDIHLLLKHKVGDMPRLEAIALFDASGDLVNFSRSWPIPNASISQQEHFRAFLSDPNLVTFVSRPFANQTVGTWSISLLRRVAGPDGEFIGLIATEIPLQFFDGFFAGIKLGQESIVSLVRSDGLPLARSPRRDNPDSSSEQRAFKDLLARVEGAVVRQKEPDDGVERLLSVHSLAHYPAAVVVGTTLAAALADWNVEAVYIIRGGTALGLVIMAAVLLGARQIDNYERRQKAVLETALDNMSQGLCMFDSDGRLVLCNQRYMQIYGLSPEQARPGLTFREIVEQRKQSGCFAGDPKQYCSELVNRVGLGETASQSVETTDGRTIHVATRPMRGGGWVATHEDVTDRRRAEDERNRHRELIARLAHYDSLTELCNRVLFYEQLDQALACPGERLAVLYIDLDQFKHVNDTLGHSLGDALLKRVAARLRGALRDIDVAGRLGGDEFAVIQRGISGASDAAALAQRIREAIGAPYELDGREIVTDASIGIALAPDDAAERNQLLKNADLALYAAKAGGRATYRFFEPQMSARMKARQELEAELRRALSNHRFELHYQPILDLRTNRVTGCEALLRWHDAERGWVSPSELIPVAEESGLIVALGEWVLRQACGDAARWPEGKKVAVNVSAAQLAGGKLAPTVLSALAESGLAPGRLEIEITETVLIQGTEDALSTLRQLHDIGVRIALDDFGIGYSSLSYLRNFPFDTIKIDQSFVRGLTEDGDCGAIVRAITGLARSLAMTTTAEGVETEQQRQKLRELGCTEMQGFLFSRPQPVAEIARLFLPHAETANAA